ncbi:MAG: hypothetical protein IID41_08590 [Planctomycetes bacterium]|nr:hypothetical protein [Planctomycetota bacterium]
MAARLRLSTRQIWKLKASGRIPDAVRVARSVRWRTSDIDDWIQLGCPSRERFEQERQRAAR